MMLWHHAEIVPGILCCALTASAPAGAQRRIAQLLSIVAPRISLGFTIAIPPDGSATVTMQQARTQNVPSLQAPPRRSFSLTWRPLAK